MDAHHQLYIQIPSDCRVFEGSSPSSPGFRIVCGNGSEVELNLDNPTARAVAETLRDNPRCRKTRGILPHGARYEIKNIFDDPFSHLTPNQDRVRQGFYDLAMELATVIPLASMMDLFAPLVQNMNQAIAMAVNNATP